LSAPSTAMSIELLVIVSLALWPASDFAQLEKHGHFSTKLDGLLMPTNRTEPLVNA